MILGIFLAVGDSFQNMAKTGQDTRFKKFYLEYFSKIFDKIYIFTYANESVTDLPKNIIVIPNKHNLHRYLYSLLLPFINIKHILRCQAFRAYHLSGTIPAITSRIFFRKPFAFNWAYDYYQFAIIENKKIQAIFSRILGSVAVFFSSKVFAANKTFLEKIPQNKTIFLPNGVDTSFFKPVKGKKHSKLIVLSVGRLEKQKNFENLIIALSGLNVSLKIVGDGERYLQLNSLAKNKNVDLAIIKRISNVEMPAIYNSSDIFVLPSLIEGSPKVLLEAMSCSLPVIGANSEGIKEIIENNYNGILCDPTPASIKKSVETLLKNRKLSEKIRKNARLYVKKNFDLKPLLEKEVKAIKSI